MKGITEEFSQAYKAWLNSSSKEEEKERFERLKSLYLLLQQVAAA